MCSQAITCNFLAVLSLAAKRVIHLALAALLILLATQVSSATQLDQQPLSGTKSIGPTGDYVSITSAIADIQAKTFGGALVLELQPAYASTVETFPLIFSGLDTTAQNTLTLRPQLGATGLSLSSADDAAATVDLNDAQFVTIDGRPGGVGAGNQLTIENTHVSGVALRFINEATDNRIQYVTLRSANSGDTSGTVVFGTTTGPGGNDRNTLDHCDIGDGASAPANGIWSAGTTTTLAQNNSNNTVSNCNIFNFYSAAANSAGVFLDAGNTDWTISGSSFYQTSTCGTVSHLVCGICVNNAAQTGGNFIITGNFIGGSAPGAGGTPWTTSDTIAPYLFQAIRLIFSNSMPSSIQGNTITNIAWNTSGTAVLAPGTWTGIYLQGGAANIGTITGNTIGSSTGTGSITYTSSGVGSSVFGISSTSSGSVTIAGNNIGSITTYNTGTNSASIVGIQVAAGTNTISGNTVGSTTTASSLNAATPSTASGNTQQVTGINASGSSSAIITGNTVANLNNNHVGAGNSGQMRGILVSNGVNTITGNTVRNLFTTSQSTGSATSSSVLGIGLAVTAAGQIVSQNVVHSLSNTAPTGAVVVTGIFFGNGLSTSSDLVTRNLVHGLGVASDSVFSSLTGMILNGGTLTAQNNLVSAGLDASGASTANAGMVTGISDNSKLSKFYHNTVYVGGTQTASIGITGASFAFSSHGQSNPRDYRNNLFCNARGNNGASARHYAVNYDGSGSHPAGLTADNNLLYAPNTGSGAMLAAYNFDNTVSLVNFSSLAALQSALNVESHSLSADPLFVNPAGTSATMDLHIQGKSPAIGAAATGTGVTDDLYGHGRSTTLPTIGAEEVISTNASLRALNLNTGPLSPSFAPTATTYTASVLRSVSTLAVTPTTDNSTARVQVSINGGSYAGVASGSASESQALNLGSNTVGVLVTAQDGTTTETYTIIVTRLTFQQGWRSQYFGTAASTGAAADTATPQNDGVTNLMKFATGLNPAFSTPQPGNVVNNSGGLEFTYPRSIDAMAECTFIVEWSDTLLPESWSSSGVTESILSATGTLQQVKATLSAGDGGTRFVRLRVTAP